MQRRRYCHCRATGSVGLTLASSPYGGRENNRYRRNRVAPIQRRERLLSTDTVEELRSERFVDRLIRTARLECSDDST